MLRCPQCRSRRATYESMQAHIKASGHTYCECGGYHYKHRLNSPYCYANPLAPLRHAMRCADLTDDEVLDIHIDCILTGTKPQIAGECPF